MSSCLFFLLGTSRNLWMSIFWSDFNSNPLKSCSEFFFSPTVIKIRKTIFLLIFLVEKTIAQQRFCCNQENIFHLISYYFLNSCPVNYNYQLILILLFFFYFLCISLSLLLLIIRHSFFSCFFLFKIVFFICIDQL